MCKRIRGEEMVMSITRKVAIVALACMFLMGSSFAFAAEKVIKLSHLNPQQPFEVATAAMSAVFKNIVESESNGSIKVEIYPAGQLGNERETMEQVQLGVVQSYIASAGGIAIFYPLYSVLDIPFALPNYEIAWEVFDGPFGQYLSKDIEDKTGFKVLGFGESGGFFQITNNKRPINSVEDMKGLKIRTMTIPTHEELMRLYGAAPTPVAWAEVYTALQTGVVDGQHNPIPIILTGRLYEVQKYITITNHMYSPYCWVMNKDFYNSLSENEKEIVDRAARVAIVSGRGLNRIIEASDKGLPALIQAGMVVNTPSPKAMEEFRRIGREGMMKFIENRFKNEGVELAQRFLQAIDEAMK